MESWYIFWHFNYDLLWIAVTKKWDRSGIIVEYRGNRQYLVRLDGSGRLSLRNRRFLKPICTTRVRKPSDGSEQLVRSYPRRVRRIPDRFSPGGRR